MRINKLYLDAALSALEKQRAANKRLCGQRRGEILEKLPEYSRLERELSENMREAVTLAFSDADGSERAIKRNVEINRQIGELLEQNGYPADYLDEIYTCPKCRDKGNTGNEWCGCLCRIINEMAAKELNSSAPLDRSGFECFDLTRYSESSENDDPSPRDIMQKNFDYCRQYAEKFNGRGKGIFMTGNTGLGKTHLSLSIARELINKGFCVVYCSVTELVRKIRDEQFDRADGDTIGLATSCDLLILDDLGAENSTDWCVSTLYEIINTRQNRDLPMIISTNLDFDEMRSVYQDRLSSRMFSMKIMFFVGKDNRVWDSENFDTV